jgi:hypothetical protein
MCSQPSIWVCLAAQQSHFSACFCSNACGGTHNSEQIVGIMLTPAWAQIPIGGTGERGRFEPATHCVIPCPSCVLNRLAKACSTVFGAKCRCLGVNLHLICPSICECRGAFSVLLNFWQTWPAWRFAWPSARVAEDHPVTGFQLPSPAPERPEWTMLSLSASALSRARSSSSPRSPCGRTPQDRRHRLRAGRTP